MNLSPMSQPTQHWSGFQYPPLIQSVPKGLPQMASPEMASPQHSSVFQPSQPSQQLFRPYNHYPTPASRNFNRLGSQLNGTRKSAFKPVSKRITKPVIEPKLKTCTAEPCFCHLSSVLNPTMAMRNQLGLGTLSRDSYHSFTNESSTPSNYDSACTACNLTTNQKKDKSNEGQYFQKQFPQYQPTAQDKVKENTYQWDMTMSTEPITRPQLSIPPKKFHAQRHLREQNDAQRANESEVPVIDLTLTDDVDHPLSAEKRALSIIELCGTPPLDANGNEIMISTDTKTMQAVRYKKAIDAKCNENEKHSSELANLLTNTGPTECTEKAKSPILYSNLMKTDCQMPSPDQSKFHANYKRWTEYLRSFNGFRLFAQRNYMKTQTHAFPKRNKQIMQTTLLKWWNSLSLAEKEQYIKAAELKWCQPLPNAMKSCEKQQNLDKTSFSQTNSPSTVPPLGNVENSSMNGTTENMIETMGKNIEIGRYI